MRWTAKLRSKVSGERRLLPLSVLGICWILLVFYAEWFRPKAKLRACKWNDGPDAARILLIADPQLIDANTYPDRNKWVMRLSQTIVDRYLAKNWRAMHQVLDPDTVVFLGDLFDGGREWKDDIWLEEYARWNTIYPPKPGIRTYMNLPGNHDIGFGDTVVRHALDRFRMYFGEPSATFEAGNYTMVFLDTISMSNTMDPTIYNPPLDFLGNLSSSTNPSFPRVLFTHVPLFRPPGSDCGKHRESQKDLPYTKGYQYVTQTSPELTDFILKNVQPDAVFSGDDHDACHVVHKYGSRTADEFTVKSCSMAMGIDRPGVQLLSLNGKDGYTTSICLLGHPFSPFLLYGAASAISLILLTMRHWPSRQPYLPLAEKRLRPRKPKAVIIRHIALEALVLVSCWLAAQLYVTGWIYGDM